MELQLEIYDRHLTEYLHNLIDKQSPSVRLQLKTLRDCGKRVIKPTIGESGVFLLKREGQAKFFGHTSCKNSWACPHCVAKRMAKYTDELGAVIEEMKKRGYFGIMVTFTIPHLRYMSCKETTDILHMTYNRFRLDSRSQNAKKQKHIYDGAVITRFFEDCQIEHQVVVGEYTYGKNGWHPHFHCIYWCKRKSADKVLSWLPAINAKWLEYAKKYTLKYWKENNLHCQLEGVMETTLDNLYSKCEQNAGVMFGQKDGKIREAQSSDYVMGWGANHELAGLQYKEAKDGHLTPHHILEKASLGDEKMAALYIEFCMNVTRKPVHARVKWSKTELIKEVRKICQQQAAARALLKKNIDKGEWKCILWFSREQWSLIWKLNKEMPLISNILFLASQASDILLEFLNALGIEYSSPDLNYFTTHIENIFNDAA